MSVNIEAEDRLHTAVLGTAFVVADGFAITAKHVTDGVQQALQGKQGGAFLGFAGPNLDTPQLQMRANFVAQGFEIAAEDAANDLALLRMNSLDSYTFSVGDLPPQPPQPIRLKPNRPDEGEAIACSGYPLREPSLVTTVGTIASAWAFDPAGSGMSDRYLADLTANPGNSGGPVYRTSDGKLVGVLVAGRLTSVVNGPGLHAAGVAELIPAATVSELLSAHGVQHLT